VPAPEESVPGLSFSADGWQLAVLQSNDDITIHDAITGAAVRHCTGADPAIIHAISLSPDGRLLAAGAPGELRQGPDAVYVWDVADERLVARRPTGGGGVCSVAFTHDGTRLVTGLWDGTALVWPTAQWVTRRPERVATSARRLEQAWDALGRPDVEGYNAVSYFQEHPAKALAFVERRLTPVRQPTTRFLRQLLIDLGDHRPDVRSAAQQKLAAVPADLGPLLRSLAAEVYPERPPDCLPVLYRQPWYQRSPAGLRQVRAVQILDRIGGPQAQTILQRMAAGWQAAAPTRYSACALRRRTAGTHAPP
jgi:hypothetical protein